MLRKYFSRLSTNLTTRISVMKICVRPISNLISFPTLVRATAFITATSTITSGYCLCSNEFQEIQAETDKSFQIWSKLWKQGHIDFHISYVNPILMQYSRTIIPTAPKVGGCPMRHPIKSLMGLFSGGVSKPAGHPSRKRMFVPCCGKSVDMVWLASKFGIKEVVGVELVQQAIDELCAEQPGQNFYESHNCSGFTFYKSKPKHLSADITVMKGDYFALQSKITGKFDAIWDRRSLTCIPPVLRDEYVRIQNDLLVPGAKILLCTVDCHLSTQKGINEGSIFSINEKEVRKLYENLPWVKSVELIKADDLMKSSPKEWEMQGIDRVSGLIFLITKRK